ncbi:hypothetical protein CBOM_03143 [Ceraceosorus bombacis]|uniref:Fatty acid hydroxylase domain-containing protein n=1 Tax=Ceraceosorus bombacis TaxID=401625 RepID=A0A0P1BN56_9BASI|nr:hypothetical protein CBOM_03143 [Ceraceosorus bombacis]
MSTQTMGGAPAPARAAGPNLNKNPRMVSTWHLKPAEELSWEQRLILKLNVLQQAKDTPKPPVFSKEKGDKVPYLPVYTEQWKWIMPRALLPLAIHGAFQKLTGWNFHPAFAFVYYFLAFKFTALAAVRSFNRMGQRYGYFDGAVPRDGIPDNMSGKVLWSMLGTVSIRPLFAIFLIYNRQESAWNIDPLMLPVQLFLYSAILDFWFYCYHRAMHTVPWLWHHHALHHKTRHPNPLLSAFADNEQEWGDILVIPLLTWLVFPVNFPTWWVCQVFIIYTEAMGHSGVRLYWQTPMTGPILRLFNMDLALEDHDLHHRRGWKVSSNYGKQTRIWDTLGGTTRDRIEGTEDNIDWVNTAKVL